MTPNEKYQVTWDRDRSWLYRVVDVETGVYIGHELSAYSEALEARDSIRRGEHTMDMKIETLCPVPDKPGVYERLGNLTSWANLAGYKSVSEAVKELKRRFSHRNPRPYRNGLEMDGDAGTIQRTWFE